MLGTQRPAVSKKRLLSFALLRFVARGLITYNKIGIRPLFPLSWILTDLTIRFVQSNPSHLSRASLKTLSTRPTPRFYNAFNRSCHFSERKPGCWCAASRLDTSRAVPNWWRMSLGHALRKQGVSILRKNKYTNVEFGSVSPTVSR